MLLDDALDGRVQRRAVGDVQADTVASVATLAALPLRRTGTRHRLQRLADGSRPGFGGGRAHDRHATRGHFQCNGAANAAGGAGDQGNLPLKAGSGVAHAKNSFVCCSVAGSNSVADCSSASMRLTMPASTLPGPHSTMCSKPRALRAPITSVQRTGPKA